MSGRRPPRTFGLFSTERQEFARAEKVHISEWSEGALWSDEAGRSFDDYDVLVDWYVERNNLPPEYAWECVRGEMAPDTAAHTVVDFIMKRQPPVDPQELDRLHRCIADWIEAQGVRMMGWIRGNKRVIILGSAR